MTYLCARTRAKANHQLPKKARATAWLCALVSLVGFIAQTGTTLAVGATLRFAPIHGPLPSLCVGDALPSPSSEVNSNAFTRKAREGVRLFLAGQYRAAVDMFTESISLQPGDPLAYYHRGIAYQRLEEYGQALSDFTVVIESGSPNDYAYLNRGAVRVKLGMLVEAESDFNSALKMEPSRPDTYFNRAFLFLKTNRGEQAIDDFTKGIGLNPKDAKAFFMRASALETFHRHAEVRRDLAEALRLDPSLTQAQDLMAQLDLE